MATRKRVSKSKGAGKGEVKNGTVSQKTHSKSDLVRTIARTESATPGELLMLQRTIGNQMMTSMIQAMLNDRPTRGDSGVSGDIEERLSASKNQGQSLSKKTLNEMEPAFGADFGGVRLHTGPDALQLTRELDSQAFTNGRDIYWGAEAPQADSKDGRRLMAHELTHVVQQNGAKKVQRKAGDNRVEIRHKLPFNRISRKTTLKYLDFVRMKRLSIYWKKLFTKKKKETQAMRDRGAYGHWWTEIGDKEDKTWTPIKSYGWWPGKGSVSTVWKAIKGVKGVLNAGESKTKDPKQGLEAPLEFHPAMEVDDTKSYDETRKLVTDKITNFAESYKAKWNYRFGMGTNCHSFQKKVMKAAGLKKTDKDLPWLKREEGWREKLEGEREQEIQETEKNQATEAMKQALGSYYEDFTNGSLDLEQALSDQTFKSNIQDLADASLEMIWKGMNIPEKEFKEKLIEKGMYFAEDPEKYPSGEKTLRMKVGSYLAARSQYEPLQGHELFGSAKIDVYIDDALTKKFGRAKVEFEDGSGLIYIPLATLNDITKGEDDYDW